MARVLRSVNNALAVLESFSVERPEMGVTELSHTLGIGKSTVHRLLTSLASRGYVRKNPDTERYCLGFKAFEVGSLVAGRGTIREITAPFLRTLMLATKETVHPGVLDEVGGRLHRQDRKRPSLQMYLAHRTPISASLWRSGSRSRPGKPRTGSIASSDGGSGPTAIDAGRAADLRRELRKSGQLVSRPTWRSSRWGSSASPRRCSTTLAGSWPRSVSRVRPCA